MAVYPVFSCHASETIHLLPPNTIVLRASKTYQNPKRLAFAQCSQCAMRRDKEPGPKGDGTYECSQARGLSLNYTGYSQQLIAICTREPVWRCYGHSTRLCSAYVLLYVAYFLTSSTANVWTILIWDLSVSWTRSMAALSNDWVPTSWEFDAQRASPTPPPCQSTHGRPLGPRLFRLWYPLYPITRHAVLPLFFCAMPQRLSKHAVCCETIVAHSPHPRSARLLGILLLEWRYGQAERVYPVPARRARWAASFCALAPLDGLCPGIIRMHDFPLGAWNGWSHSGRRSRGGQGLAACCSGPLQV